MNFPPKERKTNLSKTGKEWKNLYIFYVIIRNLIIQYYKRLVKTNEVTDYQIIRSELKNFFF